METTTTTTPLATTTTTVLDERRLQLLGESFPFVHPSIAQFFIPQYEEKDDLVHPQNDVNNHPISNQPNKRYLVDANTFLLTWKNYNEQRLAKEYDNDKSCQSGDGDVLMEMKHLQRLARDCEDLIYGSSSAAALPNTFHVSLQGLMELGRSQYDSAKITVATLLALNLLESAIRIRTTNHNAGHAPLLKNMLDRLDRDDNDGGMLSTVLKTLLLPNGFNLRNLVWHGFISNVPRSFLALTLVLIVNVESWSNHPKNDPTSKMETHQEKKKENVVGVPFSTTSVLHRGKTIRETELYDKTSTTTIAASIQRWLPISHQALWDLAVDWIRQDQYPACTCVILVILIEHGLRLEWCTVNQRSEDRCACPGAYYVTLDGHGQRHQHDLLLHPYLLWHSDEEKEDEDLPPTQATATAAPVAGTKRMNLLIPKLGGSTIALLTDLFCSSCGGPNIRAALSHGLWDTMLSKECQSFRTNPDLKSDTTTTTQTDTDMTHHYHDHETVLWDMVWAMLVALEQAAGCSSMVALSYRPVFSYTAVTMQSIQSSIRELEGLETDLQQLAVMSRPDFVLSGSGTSGGAWLELATQLKVSSVRLHNLAKAIVSTYGGGGDDDIGLLLEGNHDCGGDGRYHRLPPPPLSTSWNVDDVYKEHGTNQQLSKGGSAARVLLHDVLLALQQYRKSLHNSVQALHPTLQRGQESAADNNMIRSRERNHHWRVRSVGSVAYSLYSFTILVGLLAIERNLVQNHPTTSLSVDLKNAVERSRMVVSTFSTFLTTNADRSLIAAMNYSKAKCIRPIKSSNCG